METSIIAEGIPPEQGKFCADCKHLIGVRYKTEDAEKWGCGHPENTAWEKPSLITGIKKRVFLRSLYILRYPTSDMTAEVRAEICSSEGKWYEKYEEPNYSDHEAGVQEIRNARKSTKISADEL